MTNSHLRHGIEKKAAWPLAVALMLLLASSSAAGAATVDANANAAAGTNSSNTNALIEMRAAAEQTAKSAELQGAVKSIWRTAWDKSWPFIKNTVGKFWNLLGQAWRGLTTLGKSTTDVNTNANAAVNANAATGTNAAP